MELPDRLMQRLFSRVKKALIRQWKSGQRIVLTDSESGEIQTMRMPPCPPMNRFVF
jgi:hypothetical protein